MIKAFLLLAFESKILCDNVNFARKMKQRN